ncbi:MAG: hypothetical protein JXB17_03110, partial [Bacteroidales bacterium]|nr:hypothetical protein [Bacteroidales bacterium]
MSYTVEDGLSQGWVKCIYQDKNGFLWFGTGGAGINKFNGYEFLVYKQNPNDTTSLSSNVINVIYEDKKGNLWAGAQNGLNIYNRDLDRFYRYPVLLHENIIGFYEHDDGRLLVSTNYIIYIINFENNSAEPICPIIDGGCIEEDNFYTKIIKDIKGNLWLGSINNGLYLIDTINNTFIPTKHDENNPKSISDNYIQTVHKDNEGRVWIGTNEGGLSLMQYRNGNSSKPEFINITHDPYNKNSLNKGAIRAILDDNNGNLWVGTENGGLNILNLKSFEEGNFVFKHYINIPDDETSISNNSIYSIFQDNLGTIWIGTYGNGLNYYNKLLFKFHHFKNIPGNENSINNNLVNVFFEEGDYLWIGTEGGLDLLNKTTNTYQHFVYDPDNSQSIGSNAVWAIYKDSRNNLWVGTWAGGLNLFNRETKTFTTFLNNINDPNSIGSNNVFGILEDKDGDLWIACMNGGLNKFDYKTNTFKRYLADETKSSVTNNWVRALMESSYGEIWLSTSESVQIFNKEKEEFITFTNNIADKNSINYNGAIALFEDSKRNIWLGTEGGLNMFIREDSSFIYYWEEDGLPDNSIKGICEDDHGNLWLSTNKGISKFINGISHPENPEFKNFDVGDGLQGNEFNRRSAFKGKDGKMYFGGTNGFNVFHPDSIKDNPNKPKIVFTKFKLFNKDVVIGGKKSPLLEHISQTKSITLKHKQNVITFEYVALNYIQPEKNQYAYIMEGFDTDESGWNYVGTEKKVTFTNLNPGEYVFRVKASNNDGIWNEEGASINLKIKTPFQRSIWFYLILIIIAVSIIIVIIRIRKNIVEEEKRILQEKIKEAVKQVEEKSKEIEKQNQALLDKQKEDEIRNWAAEGMAKFSDYLR